MAKFVALWILVHVAGRLPVRILYAAGWFAGTAAWYLRPSVRRVTRSHMHRVLGPDTSSAAIDHHARRCSRATAYYYADFARAYHASRGQLLAEVEEITGIEHLFAAYDEGNGVILASAHLGNPELISYVMDTMSLDLLVLTEPLDPPRVNALVHRVRGRGRRVRYVPAGLHSVRATIEHLRAGGAAGLLIDRDVLRSGVPFPFFGAIASMPPGAVELARRTGAAFVVGSVLRTGAGRFRIDIERLPPVARTADREADVRAGMLEVVTALERAIRRDPGQWFVLSPVWPAIATLREPAEPLPARARIPADEAVQREEPLAVEALQSDQ